MTATALHKGQKEFYTNLMCFWGITGLIYGVEAITLYLLNRWILYRLARFIFIIWLQLNHSENAAYLMKQRVGRLVDPNEKAIEETFQAVTKILDKYSASGISLVREKIGQGVHQYGPALFRQFSDFTSKSKLNTSTTNINPDELTHKKEE